MLKIDISRYGGPGRSVTNGRGGDLAPSHSIQDHESEKRIFAASLTNRTSAEVYDRDTLEAHRRTMRLRTEGRKKD